MADNGGEKNGTLEKLDSELKIPPYEESGLERLLSADFLSMLINEEISDEDYRIFRLLTEDEGEGIYKELNSAFKDLQEVRKLMGDESTRTEESTWDKLDSVLSRYSRTLLRYGRDRYHYGADLANKAVHPTSYYNKSWKLSSMEESAWTEVTESLAQLSYSIYDASIGNMETSDALAESAGLTLERLLQGNEQSPLQRIYQEKEPVKVEVANGPALVPNEFAETGSTSSLKQMFPFFHYWSEKAEEFVNSEKEVNITMTVGKFFEDLNVVMNDKADTREIEDIVIKTLNRAIGVAMSTTE